MVDSKQKDGNGRAAMSVEDDYKEELLNRGISKIIVNRKGKGYLKPGDSSDVVTNMQVTVQNDEGIYPIQHRDLVSFTVDDANLPDDLQIVNLCVKTMHRNELATFNLSNIELWKGFEVPSSLVVKACHLEVELVSLIMDEDISLELDESLIMRAYERSANSDRNTPEELSTLVVSYKAFLEDDSVLENREEPLTFVWDEGSFLKVPKAVLTALLHLEKGEKAKVTAKTATDLEGASFIDAVKGQTIIFDVHLIEVSTPIGEWELEEVQEKVNQAFTMRQEGNVRFQACRYDAAQRRYEKALSYVEEVEEVPNDVKCPLYLNLAACKLQLADYIGTLEDCNKVIDMTMNNVKALFRRGCALLELDRFDEARRDFRRVLELDPKNKGASRHLHRVNTCLKEHKADLKKSYEGFFTKVKGFASDGRSIDLSYLKELPKLDPPKGGIMQVMQMMAGEGMPDANGGSMQDATPDAMDPSQMMERNYESSGASGGSMAGGMDPSKIKEMMSKMGGCQPGTSGGMNPEMMMKMMMSMMGEADTSGQTTVKDKPTGKPGPEFDPVKVMEKMVRMKQNPDL